MYPFLIVVEKKKKMENLDDDHIIVLLEGDIFVLDIAFSDDENYIQINNLHYPQLIRMFISMITQVIILKIIMTLNLMKINYILNKF